MPPCVTIGLACYNASATIQRALDSACAQDWPNIEIVVVDDASTDGSVNVIAAVADRDPRVRLIRHKMNLGAAATRNTIIGEARGDYIAFFDDDDESLPMRVTKQIHCIDAYEQRVGAALIACYASGVRHYGGGYVKQLPAIGSRGTEKPVGSTVADYLLFYRRKSGWFYGSGTPACALLARRSTFIAIGGFDARFSRVEDTDFAVRLALAGGHFIGTTEKLFVQYATNAPYKSPERNLESEQLLARKNREYLIEIDRYYYALYWPKLRYWHFRRKYGRFAIELIGLLLRYPLETTLHLLRTGPHRFFHERNMRRRR